MARSRVSWPTTLEHAPLLMVTPGEISGLDVLKVYNDGFERYVGADACFKLR